MNYFHHHFGLEVNTNSIKIKKKLKKLQKLYSKIPPTICNFCPKKKTVEADCCKHFSPPMYFVEFLDILKTIEKWEPEDRSSLLSSCWRTFLNIDIVRPCVLLDQTLCSIYEARPFSCFLPGTFVLTNSGGKNIEDVRPGEYVLTIDGTWKKVLKHLEQHYEGNIEKISCKGSLEEFCTSDHKIYAAKSSDKKPKLLDRSQWTEASDLIVKKSRKQGHYFYYPNFLFERTDKDSFIDVFNFIGGQKIKNRVYPVSLNIDKENLFGQDKQIASLPSEIKLDDDILWLIGIYLAEGSSNKSNVRFSLHSKETDISQKIVNIGKKIGVTQTIHVDGNKMAVVLNSSLLGRLMTKLCGQYAANKKISEYLFRKCDNEMLLKIAEAWNEGDGNKSLHPTLRFHSTTSSRFLAFQMYFILMSNGMIPFLYVDSRENRDGDFYILKIYTNGSKDKGQGISHKIEKEGIFSPLKTKETSYYEGPVINLEVEENHNYVTLSGLKKNCRMYSQYPKSEWKNRLETVSKQWDVPVSEIPMNEQCGEPNVSFVKKKDKELTVKEEDQIFKDIANLDVQLIADCVLGLEGSFDDKVKFAEELVYTAETYMSFDAHYILLYAGPENFNILSQMKSSLQEKHKQFKSGDIEESELKEFEKHVEDFVITVENNILTINS